MFRYILAQLFSALIDLLRTTRRSHQGLDQQSPVVRTPPVTTSPVAYRPVLGSIIKDYYRSQALLAA